MNGGYLPLPPELLLPLLLPHIAAEAQRAAGTFVKKEEREKGAGGKGGVTVEAVLKRLRRWGVDGRWERVGVWKVEEAVEWGEARAWVGRKGKGWVLMGEAEEMAEPK